MVYYGPISKGCERCRRRKIKCGEERPGCAQCAKAKVPCAGYRNRADLVFRDETARLAAKTPSAKEATAKKSVSSRKPRHLLPMPSELSAGKSETSLLLAQRGVDSFETYRWLSTEPETLQRALVPSVSHRAAGFFFENFVISDAPFTPEFGDFLKKSYLSLTPENALCGAMEALGMAGIASTSHADAVAREAKWSYGRALTMTNKALRDPKLATMDTTLAAVWFLAMFESMTAHKMDQYRSWHTHIQGAIALINLRGRKQFESDLGRILFFKFSAQVVSSCLQRKEPMPNAAASWMLAATRPSITECSKCRGSTADLAIGVSAIVPAQAGVDLCNLRAAIEQETMIEPRQIIDRAKRIETDLTNVLRQNMLYSGYRTVVVDDRSEHSFRGHYEIHPNFARAQSWNHLRTMVIMANEIIADQCSTLRERDVSGLSPEEEVLAWHAGATIRQLSLDICSSVPYMLGTLPERLLPVQERRNQVVDALAMLWPLYVCMASLYVSDDVRQWARSRLLYINHVIGIRQAGLMVEVAELPPTPRQPSNLSPLFKDI